METALFMYTPVPDPTPRRVVDQYNQLITADMPQFIAAIPGTKSVYSKRYNVNRQFGEGWTDMHEFENGVLAARMHCRFSQPLEDEYSAFPDNIRLGLRLSGHYLMTHAARELIVGAGDIVVRNADPGTLGNRIRQESPVCAIAIDIPRTMVHKLHDQGIDVSCLGTRNSCAVLRPASHLSFNLRKLGVQMLRLNVCSSDLAAIELESLCMDMLSSILTANPTRHPLPTRNTPRHWLVALDCALDIVHAEWDQPLTIASLAHRAGINECYLKAYFRQRTGQTIAMYLRKLRMQHALSLMESRQLTVQQVANFCGYLHAGKFSQAFRREHGLAPSEIC